MVVIQERAITLDLPNESAHVSGSQVSGVIHLDLRLAQEDGIEDLSISFQGGIYTRIRRQNGQTTSTYRDSIVFFKEQIQLWAKNAAFPAPGQSHILSLPFSFHFPPELPAGSFFISGGNCRGTVNFRCDVRGGRPGLLRFDRKAGTALNVVVKDDVGAPIRHMLLTTPPPMLALTAKDSIRRGLWGEYTQVECSLYLPDLAIYPANTPLPFRLEVLTVSKEVKEADGLEKDGCALIPRWSEIDLFLRTHARVTVRRFGRMERNITDETPLKPAAGVETAESPPVFVRSDEKSDKGRWRRQVQYLGAISINVTASFDSPILGVAHVLKLKIPFSGIGNKLECRMPLPVGSGLSGGEEQVPSYGNLPPAYFEADADYFDEKS